MLLPFIVFITVTGIIVGAYVAITAGPDMLQQRRLDRRLRDISAPAAAHIGAESVVMRRTGDAAFDRLTADTRAGMWLARLIEQAGARMSPGRVVLMSMVSAAACAVVVGLFFRPAWAQGLAAVVGITLPLVWLLRKRSVRMRRFEEMFPEALDLMARAVKAGHAFQSAMNMVAEELSDPVGPEFKKSFDQQNYGLPLRDALDSMAARVPIIDVRFFVTAVLIQRETGGNLSEILENLAHVVRERFKVLRQVRVHTAHGRFTGWVLLALPAALAVLLSYINPEHMQLLFKEPMGQTMLIGAVVMQLIGFFWIKQVIKIEV